MLGKVRVEFVPGELGLAIEIAEITVTECEMVNLFKGSQTTRLLFRAAIGRFAARSVTRRVNV